jgi:hypothetical protein
MSKLWAIAVAGILFAGCKSYQVTTESMVSQLKEHQKIGPDERMQKFALIDYPSNNLTEIECQDKSGNCVKLTPDKNTSFVVVKKDGKKITMYFDTVILQNDTLFGLKSRLVGGRREIPVTDVSKITISAEVPKTKPCNRH